MTPNEFILYKRDLPIAYLLNVLLLLNIHKPRYTREALMYNIEWLQQGDKDDYRIRLQY